MKLKDDIVFEGQKNGKPIISLKDVGSNKLELEDNLEDYFKIGRFYFKIYMYTASWEFGKNPKDLKDNEIKIKEDYEDACFDGCWISIDNLEGIYNLQLTFNRYLFEREQWTEFFRNKKEDIKYAIANSSNLVNFAIELIKETKPLKMVIDYEGIGISIGDQLCSWFSYSKKLDDFLILAKAYQAIKGQNKQFEGSISKILKNCAYKTFEFDEGFAVQISPTVDTYHDPEYNNFYNKIHSIKFIK